MYFTICSIYETTTMTKRYFLIKIGKKKGYIREGTDEEESNQTPTLFEFHKKEVLFCSMIWLEWIISPSNIFESFPIPPFPTAILISSYGIKLWC